MTSLLELPINSLAWLFGMAACLTLGIKSYIAYRKSNNLLTKYICWFGIIMGIALAFFSVPTFFTLDTDKLRYAWIIGEFLVYASLVAQAAVLWALMLRLHTSIYAITVPTAIIGLASWINASQSIYLYGGNNFINYSESGISSFIMAVLLGGLFIPAGFHFLRATIRQTEFKGQLTTFVLGMVYVGTGVSTASHLIFYGQVASATSSIGNLAFFVAFLGVVLWPRRLKVKTPAVAMYGGPRQT